MLGVPAIEIFLKASVDRRCQRQPLSPVYKNTSLVIFLKIAIEFGFLFLKGLLPYKTRQKNPCKILERFSLNIAHYREDKI